MAAAQAARKGDGQRRWRGQVEALVLTSARARASASPESLLEAPGGVRERHALLPPTRRDPPMETHPDVAARRAARRRRRRAPSASPGAPATSPLWGRTPPPWPWPPRRPAGSARSRRRRDHRAPRRRRRRGRGASAAEAPKNLARWRADRRPRRQNDPQRGPSPQIDRRSTPDRPQLDLSSTSNRPQTVPKSTLLRSTRARPGLDLGSTRDRPLIDASSPPIDRNPTSKKHHPSQSDPFISMPIRPHFLSIPNRRQINHGWAPERRQDEPQRDQGGIASRPSTPSSPRVDTNSKPHRRPTRPRVDTRSPPCSPRVGPETMQDRSHADHT